MEKDVRNIKNRRDEQIMTHTVEKVENEEFHHAVLKSSLTKQFHFQTSLTGIKTLEYNLNNHLRRRNNYLNQI